VSGHPEYTLKVKDNRTLQEYEVNNRFKLFRDLKKKLDAESKGLIESPFPKTFAKSKMGVKLTEKELNARVEGLYVRASEGSARERRPLLRWKQARERKESVCFCGGSRLASAKKACASAAESGSLSERKESRLLLFWGGNRLAQRVLRRCCSAAEAGRVARGLSGGDPPNPPYCGKV
jgi:hypothetical protein